MTLPETQCSRHAVIDIQFPEGEPHVSGLYDANTSGLQQGLAKINALLQVSAVSTVQGVAIMWLSGKMRQAFAMAGLSLAAILAYQALEEPIYLIPTAIVFGLTKLGIWFIPWQG